MVNLRFGKDYRMDLVETPGGKKERKMIYVGPLYAYVDTEEAHSKQRIFFTVSGALAMVLFLAGFSFYSNISRVWFASIPYACNLLVLYLYIEGAFYFWKYRDRLNREQKEKGGDRFKSTSLVASVLCFVSMVSGFVSVFFYLDAVVINDYLFLGIDLLLLMLTFFVHVKAKEITYREEPNPVAKEWADK